MRVSHVFLESLLFSNYFFDEKLYEVFFFIIMGVLLFDTSLYNIIRGFFKNNSRIEVKCKLTSFLTPIFCYNFPLQSLDFTNIYKNAIII